jgi:hypothetical protein
MTTSTHRPFALRRPITAVLGLIGWSLIVAPAAAQRGPSVATAPTAPPSARAVRITTPPVVDGTVLNDPVWQAIEPIRGFWQEQPLEGQPASEETEVRIAYTADTLYVSVVLHDREPGAIIVSDSRRDAPLEESDSFRMILDTYRDRLNGFVFGTNPAGIEYDGQVTNEGQGGGGLGGGQTQQAGSGSGFNLNWDGAWEVRAGICEVGWTAEFAIPFRTIRFASSSDREWGLNFQRNIRRRNERSYWAPITRQFNLYRLSLAGSLTGLETPVLRSLRATPYVLGSVVESGARPTSADGRGDVGVDVKFNPSPSLTIDGTVNTDFAQVEVDEQQVNLDRFNVFFPEKRPFFLENAGFFSVGNPGEVDLFFSRRIGIGSGGREIPIRAGGRLSGKVGQFNVGLLNMQTGQVGDDIAGNNFSVVRVSRDLPNRSSVGGLFVNRQGVGALSGDDDHNRTFALDGKFGIRQHTMLSTFVAKTETPGIDTSDHAFNIRSRTSVPRFDLDLGYQELGDNFNPEVGFMTRRGYRKPDVRLMTRWRPTGFGAIQELRPHSSYRAFIGFDGFLESSQIHVDNHWQFRNSAEIHTGMNFVEEGVRTPFEIYPGIWVPPGSYPYQEGQFVFTTNQGAPVSLDFETRVGGFFGGDRVQVTPTFRLRLGETLTTELAYQRNDIDLPWGTFSTNLLRTRVSYSFNTRAFVQALVQYNDRADLWSMNLRFGWQQAANTGLYVVYTDTRGLYELTPEPLRTDRSLTIKFSKLFDLLQ